MTKNNNPQKTTQKIKIDKHEPKLQLYVFSTYLQSVLPYQRICGQIYLFINIIVNFVLSSMLWFKSYYHRSCGKSVLSSMLWSMSSCHRCCGQCRLVIEVVLNSSLSQQLRSILSSHQIQSALDLFCGHNQIPRKHDRPCKASYPQQGWY